MGEAALQPSESSTPGLVLEPQQWPWSSARDWLTGKTGPVLVNEALRAEMKVRPVA
jgi:hypothetical protein